MPPGKNKFDDNESEDEVDEGSKRAPRISKETKNITKRPKQEVRAGGRKKGSKVSQADLVAHKMINIKPADIEWRAHDFTGKKSFLIGSWNIQGQGSGTGHIKLSKVVSYFNTRPDLDAMLLQEAGNCDSERPLANSKASERSISYDSIDLTKIIDKVPGMPNKAVLLHRFVEFGRCSLGVLWYTDGDAGNPRCSMAVVYRRTSLFPDFPEEPAEDLTNREKERQRYMNMLLDVVRVSYYSDSTKPGKTFDLRPVIGLQFPGGHWIYNIHAPSTSNRFPAKVAFHFLGMIAGNEGRSVIAGDFNFTPGKACCMESRAAAARIKNFTYDLAPTPTQKSGGTLDFAMGTLPIMQVGREAFDEFKTKKNLAYFLQGKMMTAQKLKGGMNLQEAEDEMHGLITRLANLDNDYDKALEAIKKQKVKKKLNALFDKIEEKSDALLKMRLGAKWAIDKGYESMKKEQGSDHIAQFFLIGTGIPLEEQMYVPRAPQAMPPGMEIEGLNNLMIPENKSL